MKKLPAVLAYEFECVETGILSGRSRLVEPHESLTVMGKDAENTRVKLRTHEGWIAWAEIDDVVKLTLN